MTPVNDEKRDFSNYREIPIAHFTVAFVLSACLTVSMAAAPEGDDSTSSQSGSEVVTIGVYFLDADGEYKLQEDRNLVMEVGVPCFVWSRETASCEEISTKHLHYNAADETSYVDRTFVWTEYGPKHSEEDIRTFCETGVDGVGPKKVDWTTYFEESGRPGKNPYYLKIIDDGSAKHEEADCPPIEHFCADVEEYQGPNAIPAVTMQLRPSLGGDTVANDADYPPGTGEMVVVGFWEHPPGYMPEMDGDTIIENPCAGEPTMKIAYPIDYGAKTCYAWGHWVLEDTSDPTLEEDDRYDLHPNSAKFFECSQDGDLSLTQWTTMTCKLDDPDVKMANCRQKTAFRTRCCRDNPEMIWSQILSGCGKEPPRPKP